jgi:hypothetical protein
MSRRALRILLVGFAISAFALLGCCPPFCPPHPPGPPPPGYSLELVPHPTPDFAEEGSVGPHLDRSAAEARGDCLPGVV